MKKMNVKTIQKKTMTYALAASMVAGMIPAAGVSAAQKGNAPEKAVRAAEETTAENADVQGPEGAVENTGSRPESKVVVSDKSFTSTADGESAILADGEDGSYTGIQVTKTGDSSGDEADFYGTNAAILAKNNAELTISDAEITTNGSHANAVFSYGTGTTVNISNTEIHTTGNNSGGIMTTGGGTMNAENLEIHTEGNSSAAIRSDRGGGDVNVKGGTYETSGVGSPAIYSTADIDVENATLISNVSEAVVVEGGNSVTLTDCTVSADHTKKNGQSTTCQNVMLYQSMSGDASDGSSEFTMTGGSMECKNGSMFYVTNTNSTINLTDAELTTESGDLLLVAAGAWGRSGSNGGTATVNATDQKLEGSITVDSISTLNLKLSEDSDYTGAINASGAAGNVYVELTKGCKWTLTDDSYISSLSCDEAAIDLNGHTLYVDGTAYTEGTASTGSAFETASSTGSAGNVAGGQQMGQRPELPNGASGEQGQMPQMGEQGQAPEMIGSGTEGQQMGQRPELPNGANGEQGQMPEMGEQGQAPEMIGSGTEGQQMGERPELPNGANGEQGQMPEMGEQGQAPEMIGSGTEGQQMGQRPELPNGANGEQGQMPQMPGGENGQQNMQAGGNQDISGSVQQDNRVSEDKNAQKDTKAASDVDAQKNNRVTEDPNVQKGTTEAADTLEDEEDQNAGEDGIEVRKENGKTYLYQDGEKLTGTRLVETEDGTYYLKKGVVATSKTGVVKVDGTYVYVKKGVVSSYTGMKKYGLKKLYFKNGYFQKVTGLKKVDGKYLYFKNGVFKKYTGIVENGDKSVYVKKGVKSTKTGTVKVKGTSYTLKKGVVQE